MTKDMLAYFDACVAWVLGHDEAQQEARWAQERHDAAAQLEELRRRHEMLLEHGRWTLSERNKIMHSSFYIRLHHYILLQFYIILYCLYTVDIYTYVVCI